MAQKTFDECYWFTYDSNKDLCLFEVGRFHCPTSYGYCTIISDTYIMHFLIR